MVSSRLWHINYLRRLSYAFHHGVVEDSMILCIVSCRQIDKGSSCDHAPMLVILYVLSEVYSGLMHDFPGLTTACSLLRCPSTIGATCVSIFHITYTCDIVVISVCMVSVWHWSSTILVPCFLWSISWAYQVSIPLCKVGPWLFSCFTSKFSMPAAFPFLGAAIPFLDFY